MRPLNAEAEFGFIPHLDQYMDVWGMREQDFNALLSQAQSINVSLHLSNVAAGANPNDLQARTSEEFEVTEAGVAVIPITGSIMKHASSWSANTSTVATRRKINAAVRSGNVNSILLLVDSPGGSVKGLQDLVETVQGAKQKKPVYAYVEDLAASAAYWIASQAEKVYGNTHAVVGSIGVFSVVYDMSRAAENEGIKVHVLKEGAFKGAGVPGTEVTEQQLAEFQRHVSSYYAEFIDAVAAGRGLDRKTAEALADGRVHRGRAAVDLQLIDGIQSIEKTLSEMANIGQPQQKGRKMSAELNTAAADKPAAATPQQVKQLCPGAGSDFVLEQIEKGATAEQVKDAWIAEQSKQISQLQAANQQKEQEAAEAAKESQGRRSPGVPPLDEGNASVEEASADSAERFHLLAKEYQAKHPRKTFAECCHAVGQQHREMYKAYLQAASQPARHRRGLDDE